jgi:fucose permease
MGYISDATNIQRAFLVPLVCYAYILYFSVNGHQKAALPSGAPSLAMEIE